MDRILILDFGSQVTQLIARRVRENGVYSEIWPFTSSLSQIRDYAPKAIILSGGPSSVEDIGAPTIDKKIFELGVPVLGICYGQQLMCQLLGGTVEGSDKREFGRAFMNIAGASPLFSPFWKKGSKYPVWMSHGDSVTKLPTGFKVIAKTGHAPFAAVADEKRKLYGVQFHPEVVHTKDGGKLLRNFTHRIAKCKGDWTMASFLEMELPKIRKIVGKKKVICAVSGGVDSSVVALLLHRAIGKQLVPIFVDHGLLRLNEAEFVENQFKQLGIPLIVAKKQPLFLSRLAGVTDPEKKRKIIGNTFIDVFDEEAGKVADAEFLAQGTLYPDVIESVSVHGKASSTIKSHHNVGGLPEKMNLKLIEPLRELFKDEVRALGKELGLPTKMVGRHPFPGPGLAIRIPGEVTEEKLEILKKADAIFIEALHEFKLYNSIWQAFAALLPVRTVGVMGDARTYEYVCALRAVTSTDGMTADTYPFTHPFLSEISNRIINQVRGINRVVYDITSKPPGTIEWE